MPSRCALPGPFCPIISFLPRVIASYRAYTINDNRRCSSSALSSAYSKDKRELPFSKLNDAQRVP